MKKTFNLENLDCANCAMKMENRVNKIDGVKKANFNFIMQKLVIEADDENSEKTMDEVVDVCKKVDYNCKIIRK